MKKNGMMKMVTWMLAIFFAIFAGYHAFRHFFSSYSSVSTYRYTVNSSVLTSGIMLRDERTLEQPYSGNLRFIADEGEKVKVGTPVADTYSSEESANRAETAASALNELLALQAVLQKMQQDSYVNASELSGSIDLDFKNLSKAIQLGDYSALDEQRIKLQSNINAKEYLTGNRESVTERILALQSNTATLQSTGTLNSTAVGYFSHCVDHYESTYSTAMVGSITSETFAEMLSADYSVEESALGKVVLNDSWYLVTRIGVEQGKNFPLNSEVYITFAGSDNRSVEAVVYSIQPNEDGKTAIVTFYGNEINSDTVSRRCTSVKISTKPYTGIRFDSELLRIVDGVKGVYIDAGYTAEFKRVEIIYAGNDYYLSRLNYSSEEYLNLFDKLLITDSELYDGKPLSDL